MRRILQLLFTLTAASFLFVTPSVARAQNVAAFPYIGPLPGVAQPAPKSDPANPALANISDINPLRVLAGAGDALQGFQSLSGTPESSASRKGGSGGLSGPINILVVLTVVALAPTIMLMTTCFVRVIIVLGLLKQAIGTQTLPPPQVIVTLALFITLLVMSPTFDRIHREAIIPYQTGSITNYDLLWAKTKQPIRDFMFDQIDATGNWSSVYMVLNYRGIDTSDPVHLTTDKVDMVSLAPAFLLSELKAGFLIGFKVYLPFLVIDMVISAILLSMGMMMLPPVLISLPFKLLLFVLVDGWQLVVGSLMQSFVTHPTATALHTLDPPWLLHAASSLFC